MTDFGDIELADSWDISAVIAQEQVAYRLHDLIRQVDRLGGGNTPEWDDLSPEAQELGFAIVAVLVDWIINREPDNPAHTAEQVHNVRVWLSRGAIPSWGDLPNDQRQLSIDLMILVIAWLEREGPR